MRNRVDYYERTDYTMFTIAEIFELIKCYFEQLKAIIADDEAGSWLDFIRDAAKPLVDKFGDKTVG